MKTLRKQHKLSSTTSFGVIVTTDIPKQQTVAYNNGKLIFKKNLCGSLDLGQAHLNNVLEFMKEARTKDLRKPLNF